MERIPSSNNAEECNDSWFLGLSQNTQGFVLHFKKQSLDGFRFTVFDTQSRTGSPYGYCSVIRMNAPLFVANVFPIRFGLISPVY